MIRHTLTAALIEILCQAVVAIAAGCVVAVGAVVWGMLK